MKISRQFMDKCSIGLSMLCTIHCLVLPILLLLIPSLTALQLDNEEFHTWMLIAVVPTSIYALTMGCKKHKRHELFVIGSLGLISLTLAVILEHDFIGEFGEKALTLLGTSLVVLAHWRNFRLCLKHQKCPCADNEA